MYLLRLVNETAVFLMISERLIKRREFLFLRSDGEVSIMKRGLLVLGLIIFLIGIVVTPWAALSRKKIVLSTETVEVINEVEVLGNFGKGNRLTLTITQGLYWMAYDRTDEFDFPHLPVDVSIVDPKGGKTNFTAIFAQAGSGALGFFTAKLTSNDGGLAIEEENVKSRENEMVYCFEISGIVNYNGTYKAVVSHIGLPTPPARLTLSKQVIEVGYPYLFVIPIGGAFIVSGAVLSIWATKGGKHKRHRRENRK